MRLKCVALCEFTEKEFQEYAVSKVISEIVDITKSLVPFNIKPEGELKTATTNNARFGFDENTGLVTSVPGARASQYFTGRWLDFLHAERAKIIPRQEFDILANQYLGHYKDFCPLCGSRFYGDSPTEVYNQIIKHCDDGSCENNFRSLSIVLSDNGE